MMRNNFLPVSNVWVAVGFGFGFYFYFYFFPFGPVLSI